MSLSFPRPSSAAAASPPPTKLTHHTIFRRVHWPLHSVTCPLAAALCMYPWPCAPPPRPRHIVPDRGVTIKVQRGRSAVGEAGAFRPRGEVRAIQAFRPLQKQTGICRKKSIDTPVSGRDDVKGLAAAVHKNRCLSRIPTLSGFRPRKPD